MIIFYSFWQSKLTAFILLLRVSIIFEMSLLFNNITLDKLVHNLILKNTYTFISYLNPLQISIKMNCHHSKLSCSKKLINK